MPAQAGGEGAIEWIEEPLGKGVRAGFVRLFRAGCILSALAMLVVGMVGFVTIGPELAVWIAFGATALFLGFALRFSSEFPDRLGLAEHEFVVVVAGTEKRVPYRSILGLTRAEGASATTRLRFRSGPGRIGGVADLLLDREVAERVVARASRSPSD